MAGTGRLELQFVDVHGLPIGQPVDIHLRHHVFHEEHRVNDHDGTRPIAITGLRTEPEGLYVLEVRAPSYYPVSRFVTIPASGTLAERIILPIKPDRAQGVFPAHDQLDERVRGVLERSSAVKGHEGQTGRALYDALSDESKGGLLNIAKKSLATPFRDGSDLLRHTTLLDIRGDRCFVEVPTGLRKQVATFAEDQAVLDTMRFRSVNGSLHEPPQGFEADGSFKTLDAFGNLQMTFFKSGDRCRVDIDIDDAAGLGHVFQVLRNHLTGSPTHPYNIHQILLTHQHLDPGYRLIPRKS